MANPLADEPLFDLASYARTGSSRRDRLSPSHIAQISRTVRRAPEVMVKVLSRGGQDLKAVARHLEYLRHRQDGELEVETDDGRRLSGASVTKELQNDWDLDLEVHRNRSSLDARRGGSQKLVHKLLFSMPPGTSPQKVLSAVKALAREEFALKHRYAMVLHTDEPHPHVHMVIKAVSEQGERLHIRKSTLRDLRRAFAAQLRALGVEANATERAVRGATESRKSDGIFRASRDSTGHRHSTHVERRVQVVAAELRAGRLQVERGKHRLVATRREVVRSWRALSDVLLEERQPGLAREVLRFVAAMPPPLTEKEQLAATLVARTRASRGHGPHAR